MARGTGIPIELKRKLAEHFEKNGFTKKSRMEAQTLYESLSNSDRYLTR